MMIKHPVLAGRLFANSLLTGIAAIWKWTVALVTQTIPAMIKFSIVMLKNAIMSIASFVTSIVTVAIPALITFAATFFYNSNSCSMGFYSRFTYEPGYVDSIRYCCGCRGARGRYYRAL